MTTVDHSALVHETRLALGTYDDFVLWRNAVTYIQNGVPKAKPGLGTGSLDLIGILAPSGRLVALDAKTGNAVASKEQKLFMSLVRKMGGFAATFRTVEEAEAAVERARRGAYE